MLSALPLQLRLLFRMREVASGMQFLHDVASVVHGEQAGLFNSVCLSCATRQHSIGQCVTWL